MAILRVFHSTRMRPMCDQLTATAKLNFDSYPRWRRLQDFQNLAAPFVKLRADIVSRYPPVYLLHDDGRMEMRLPSLPPEAQKVVDGIDEVLRQAAQATGLAANG